TVKKQMDQLTNYPQEKRIHESHANMPLKWATWILFSFPRSCCWFSAVCAVVMEPLPRQSRVRRMCGSGSMSGQIGQFIFLRSLSLECRPVYELLPGDRSQRAIYRAIYVLSDEPDRAVAK